MELRDVQACLRAGIADRATMVGPFLVLLNDKSDNPFLNYAVPTDGAAPTAADVAALVGYFTDRARLPRLEYVRPAPDVDAPLVAAGFDVAATLTLMAVDELVEAPDGTGYDVVFPTDEDTLRQAAAVQDVAYGEQREPDPAGLLALLERGGLVAVAVRTATGTPAGAGVFAAPRLGLVEIAGVGVLPDHRRRGIGRQVTTALTVEAMRRGHRPFLQVEKDEPARVYERIGYRVIGEMADARRLTGS